MGEMRDSYFTQHVRSMDDVSRLVNSASACSSLQGLINCLGRQYINVFVTFLVELQWPVRPPSGGT